MSSTRNSAPKPANPSPAAPGSNHRDAARTAVAPGTKEPPDASVLDTIGAAVTQPVRDAASARSDRQITATHGGRDAGKASTDGPSEDTPQQGR